MGIAKGNSDGRRDLRVLPITPWGYSGIEKWHLGRLITFRPWFDPRFRNNNMERLNYIAEIASSWAGSVSSIMVHTIVFATTFMLPVFGIPLTTVLLILTTVVSLEAIYLQIFIQMTVNRHSGDIRTIHDHLQGR